MGLVVPEDGLSTLFSVKLSLMRDRVCHFGDRVCHAIQGECNAHCSILAARGFAFITIKLNPNLV
jgi:hypothetical protein